METEMATGKEVKRKAREVFLYDATPWKELTEYQRNFLLDGGFCYPDGTTITRYIDPFDEEWDEYYPYAHNNIMEKKYVKWALMKFNSKGLSEFFRNEYSFYRRGSNVLETENFDEEIDKELAALVEQAMKEILVEQPEEYRKVMDKLSIACDAPCFSPEVKKLQRNI